MPSPVRPLTRWLVVVAFALAMAWVESASVYYLRALVGRIEPYQSNPLPLAGTFGQVELVREAATLVMLLTIGIVAGTTWQQRFGYTAIAFGVWDILYYAFLRIMTAWPRSMLDWDILFLIPLPWWGPVLAPVSIAALMIVWGTCVTQLPESRSVTSVTRLSWAVTMAGVALALYVFMADAVHTIDQGIEATRQVLPTRFNWTAFCVALALMSAPVAEIGWRGVKARRLAAG
jgi:hypothetical protein